MTYIVGLTGGIGSGKARLQISLLNLVYPLLMQILWQEKWLKKGSPLLAQIAEHFGKSILTEEGELNRSELRKKYFQTRMRKTGSIIYYIPRFAKECLHS